MTTWAWQIRRWTMPLAMGLVLLLGLAAASAETQGPPSVPLPTLRAAIDQTSVSGISSGAYMAGQFQIAHSQIVVGAAIIAGGPYGCAESTFSDNMWGPGTAFFNLSKAVNGCMLNALEAWGVPDPEQLARRTKQLAEQGRIDPIDGIIRDRIYLFSGTKDHTVVPSIVAAAVKFYRSIGVPDANIKLVADLAAGHAFIVDAETANACERSVVPVRRRLPLRPGGRSARPHLRPACAPRRDRERRLRCFRSERVHKGSRRQRAFGHRRRIRARCVPRLKLAAASTSPFTAAARTGRRSATPSSRRPASVAGPTPTG